MDETWREVCRNIRQSVGVYHCHESCLLEIKGEDALSYLHSQTTQDLLQLQIGEGAPCAILDRLAKIQSIFHVYRLPSSLWILVHHAQKQKVIESIERFHVTEDFTIIDHSEVFDILALEGPLSHGILKLGLNEAIDSKAYHVFQSKVFTIESAIFTECFFGGRGFLIACSKGDLERLTHKLIDAQSNSKCVEVDEHCQRILRLEAGQLAFGKELTEDNILPGTGLEKTHICYDKGCFVGQEVVARIRTYGKAPRFVVGAIAQTNAMNSLPTTGSILINDKEVGEVLTHYPSPNREESSHFILLLKKNLDFEESKIQVLYHHQKIEFEIKALPFFNPKQEQSQAENLYNQALKFFSETSSEETDRVQEDNLAIQHLKEAIALDPGFSDAYEVLGVLLGRQERYQEAIEHMRSLTLVDPSSIMAHSNLSLYYMKIGDIDTAEKYKADATALSFKSAAALAKQKRNEGRVAEEKRQDAERKKSMFQEVLSIDANDIPALYGLGQCNYDLQAFEDALEPLTKAIELKEDYSVAYLCLGRCFEELKQNDRAIEAYQNGIRVAEKKGDLMPLKEMEQQLYRLRN